MQNMRHLKPVLCKVARKRQENIEQENHIHSYK